VIQIPAMAHPDVLNAMRNLWESMEVGYSPPTSILISRPAYRILGIMHMHRFDRPKNARIRKALVKRLLRKL